jgi:hypothetical protein
MKMRENMKSHVCEEVVIAEEFRTALAIASFMFLRPVKKTKGHLSHPNFK